MCPHLQWREIHHKLLNKCFYSVFKMKLWKLVCLCLDGEHLPKFQPIVIFRHQSTKCQEIKILFCIFLTILQQSATEGKQGVNKPYSWLLFQVIWMCSIAVSKFPALNAKFCCHHSCGVGGKAQPEMSRSNCKLLCMLSIDYKLQQSLTQLNKLHNSGKRLACCCIQPQIFTEYQCSCKSLLPAFY